MQPIIIYGSGGFARELAWLIEECTTSGQNVYRVVCFVDDDPQKQGTYPNDIPVLSLVDAFQQYPRAQIVGGIGSPQTREKTMHKAQAMGFVPASFIHPNVVYSARWTTFGPGTVICAGNILTVNITLGQHVHLNLDCTIGHDVILDDYVTLAPGAHVSGWVHLGKRVYVGTGATFINGTDDNPLTVADDVVIGAGACVTKPIHQSGVTVVGVPAKVLSR
ncbi:MAG: acetyltransferase [Anaerolineales bacterium]